MFERFTAGARAAVVAEARRRGDRRIGTEHLLLGVIHEAEAAQALGVDVESARSALAVLDEPPLPQSAWTRVASSGR